MEACDATLPEPHRMLYMDSDVWRCLGSPPGVVNGGERVTCVALRGIKNAQKSVAKQDVVNTR